MAHEDFIVPIHIESIKYLTLSFVHDMYKQDICLYFLKRCSGTAHTVVSPYFPSNVDFAISIQYGLRHYTDCISNIHYDNDGW